MKPIPPLIALMAVLGAFALMTWQTTTAADPDDQDKIRALLKHYERALNDNDVTAIMKLYGDDSVFMPQHSPPQIGRDSIRTAYNNVFNAIDLDITFNIDEITQTGHRWAFARTTSAGTTTINATSAKNPENNQELFVLEKQADDQWRIARYIFSTTNPRQQH